MAEPGKKYEGFEVPLGLILGSALLLIGLVGISVVSVTTLLHHFSTGRVSARRGDKKDVDPTPSSGAFAMPDWRRVRVVQEVELTEYRWVDRQAGIVAVPLDRAELLLLAGASPAIAPREGR
jgi:hypothetical protein